MESRKFAFVTEVWLGNSGDKGRMSWDQRRSALLHMLRTHNESERVAIFLDLTSMHDPTLPLGCSWMSITSSCYPHLQTGKFNKHHKGGNNSVPVMWLGLKIFWWSLLGVFNKESCHEQLRILWLFPFIFVPFFLSFSWSSTLLKRNGESGQSLFYYRFSEKTYPVLHLI